ncbi:hypothetical protein [Mesorhizobium sp. M0478]|uniref:hypothetical protein n=1 Tax=Mesorhizobium sp. M0478 TaxID=2956947 RepID=UPI00333D1DB5
MNGTEAARLALAHRFRNPDEMRRWFTGSVLTVAKERLAQKPSAAAQEWKLLSTTADAEAVLKTYYPPQELERQRENTRRATDHATAYIAAELQKAKERRERRDRKR